MEKKTTKKKASKPIETFESGEMAALIFEKKTQTDYRFYEAKVGRITKRTDKGIQISDGFYDYHEQDHQECVRMACNWIRNKNLERSQPTQVAA